MLHPCVEATDSAPLDGLVAWALEEYKESWATNLSQREGDSRVYDSAAPHLVRILDLSTANTSPFNLAPILEIIDSVVKINVV